MVWIHHTTYKHRYAHRYTVVDHSARSLALNDYNLCEFISAYYYFYCAHN
jgi:hypothetical protein